MIYVPSCTLLLLDNLDFENPWGPTGSMGCISNLSDPFIVDGKMGNSKFMYNHQTHLKFVLGQLSQAWIGKALRMNQLDRLLAPILAALMHPSTARISLKSFIFKQFNLTNQTNRLDLNDQPIVNQELIRFQQSNILFYSIQILI